MGINSTIEECQSLTHFHTLPATTTTISSLKIDVLPGNPTIYKYTCRKRSFTLRQQAQNIWCNFLGLKDLPADWPKKPPKINMQVVCEEEGASHSPDLSLRQDGLWHKINYEVAFFQEYHSTKRMGRGVCGIPGIWGKALSKELPRKKGQVLTAYMYSLPLNQLLPSIYHNHVIYRW